MKKRKIKKEIAFIGSTLMCFGFLMCWYLKDDEILMNQEKIELRFDTNAQKTIEKEEVQTEYEFVEYPGFASQYHIDENIRYLALQNPKENSSFFVYTILKDGEVLFQSDLIEPDYEVMCDLYDVLNEGDHLLNIKIDSYDIQSQIKDFYSPNYQVCISVEKEL